MKILIVEDELLVAEDLKEKLVTLQYAVTAIADSYETALTAIEDEKPDLVLVDIELKGELSGIDLAKRLNGMKIPFIYLSGIQDMNTYLEAKSTNPLKNLAKPIDLLNLRNTLMEIDLKKENAVKPEEILHFFTNKEGIKERVEPGSIVYIEADRSYCDVYFVNGSRSTLSSAMGNVVKKLNHPDIIQISRSHHINRKHIQRIRGNEVQMVVGDFMKISDSHREAFSRQIKVF